VAERRSPRTVPISLVIGAIAVIVAGAVWFDRKNDATMTGSVARCTAVQRAAHPAQCRTLDATPAVLVRGPISPDGIAKRTHRVSADTTRRFSVRLARGTYDVFVLIGDTAIQPPGGAAGAVRRLSSAGIAGLRVAPGPAWQLAGRLSQR
jgi:hypothetical protein